MLFTLIKLYCENKMNTNKITISEMKKDEISIVLEIEAKAFQNEKEPELTNNLIHDNSADPSLSLIAWHDEKPVGHILFTRTYINEKDSHQPLTHLLAPLAIIPEYQKQGIGQMLIKEGLRILKERGSHLVLVIGHIDYYPRAGFINDAGNYGYETPYPIPVEVKDAWMYYKLTDCSLIPKSGRVLVADALMKPEYWRE